MRIIITTTWNCSHILSAFLDHHRMLGFDRVMVMDFDSTDGTRDVLTSSLYDDFVDVVPFPGLAGLDSSNLMLLLARARFPASTLCLFCDPDEFLVLGLGQTISDLDYKDAAALVVTRYNMTGLRSVVLADPNCSHPFGCLNIRIDVRAIRSHSEIMTGELDTPWIFTAVGPKVIVRLDETISIGDGDHSAVVHGRSSCLAGPEVFLLHYPLSTFARFEQRVELSRADFYANQALSPFYGWHQRRWIRLADEKRLWSEYISLFVEDAALSELVTRGTVSIYNDLRDLHSIANVLLPSSSASSVMSNDQSV